MIKEVVYKIILSTGIIPASLLLYLSFFGIMNILSLHEISNKYLFLLLAIAMGIVGYFGLLTSLFVPKKTKLNFLLLLIGLAGISLFLSLEGGIEAWKWLILMKEPDEWLIIAWPMIAALCGLIVNLLKQFKTHASDVLLDES